MLLLVPDSAKIQSVVRRMRVDFVNLKEIIKLNTKKYEFIKMSTLSK